MASISITRKSAAILASACLTSAAMFDWPFLNLLLSTSYDRAVEGYCHVDHWRTDPSLAARILSISIFLFAPIAAAVFTALSVARARIWSGALAAGASQFVACVAISTLHSSLCKSWSEIPDDFLSITIIVVAFALLGGIAAWLALRWRPNTSLERTREG
jgi:hypothetical protein